MIVLKILLYLLLAIFGIILLLFILPVRAEASFIGGRFRYKVGFWLLNIMDSEGGGLLKRLKKRRRGKAPEPEDDDDDWAMQEDSVPSGTYDDEAKETSVSGDDVQFTAEDTAPAEDIPSAESVSESPAEPVREEKEPHKKRRKKEKPPREPRTLGEKVEFLMDLWRAADRPALKVLKGFHFYDLYIDFIPANEDAYKCAVNYGRISGLVYNLLGFMSALFTVRLQTVDINAGFGLKESRWDAAVKLRFRLGTMVIAGVWFLITYIFRYFIPEMMQQMKLKKTAARQK